jgi:chromosome segregation ATPase
MSVAQGTDELTNSRNSFSADQHQEQDTSTPSQLRILEEQLTQAKDEIQTARDAHRSALLAQKLAEARELEMRVEKDALAQRDKELEYELANLSKANAEKSGEEARLRDEIAALRAGVQSYETELLKMTERIAELQTQAEKAESAFLHAEQFGIEAQAEKGDLFSKVAQLEKERDALSLASEYLTKQYTSVSQELHEAKLEISAIKKQLQAVQAQASLDDSAATKVPHCMAAQRCSFV